MLDLLKKVGHFLERFERIYPRTFWLSAIVVAFLFNSINSKKPQIEDEFSFQKIQTSAIVAINSGGGESKPKSGSVILQTSLGKRKNFNINFHRRLEQYFPDWKDRIDYQKKQEKFYRLAMRRRSELKRIIGFDNKSFYTKEELDAMDYFHGTGFYKEYQHPKRKPNKFDTRQTFLIKMHDPVLRNNFLNSLNNKNYLNYLKFSN